MPRNRCTILAVLTIELRCTGDCPQKRLPKRADSLLKCIQAHGAGVRPRPSPLPASPLGISVENVDAQLCTTLMGPPELPDGT